MLRTLLALVVMLLFLPGCGTSSSLGSSPPPAVTPQVATIRLNQVLLRSVPQEVTEQRFTGFDSQGQVRYGPVTRAKAATIELTGVPTAVVRLQIEYLQGETVIGLGSVALELSPGEVTEINNPPFQDVVSALSSLQVTPGGATIADGSRQQFTVIGTFADNTQLDLTSSATWSSSNPAVATIVPGGLATAVEPGQTNISAAIGPVTDSTTLTVSTATIASVQVSPANPVVAAGTTQEFSATATLTDGTTQDVTSSADWTSSSPAVATIVPNTGVATAVASGQSTITATAGGVSGSTDLTVSNATVTTLVVSPGNPTLANGTTRQFQVIANFTSGPSQDVTSSALWSSSDDSVATISATGLATAVGPGGPVTIQASFGGQTAGTNLTVTDAEVASIEVTPLNPVIPDGLERQFTAIATLTDGSTLDVTGSANWTSDTTATATVAPGGLATAVNPGQTLIVATSSNGVQGSTTLTVTEATVETLTVTPPNPVVANGMAQQFIATATFTDSSTRDVTSSANWTSGTPGVATVTSPGGLATALADSGSSLITATFQGASGSTTLTASAAIVESVTVTPNPSVLALGQTQQFTAVATLSNGTTPDVSDQATWGSDDTGIATIVTDTGFASAAGVGNTRVTATFGGQTGSAAIVVSQAVLESLVINPPEAISAEGSQRQYSALGRFSDGTTRDLTTEVLWTTSNSSVATIANDNLGPNRHGLATVGGSQGQTVEIRAQHSSGLQATSNLTIDQFMFVSFDADGATGFLILSFRVDPSTGGLTLVQSPGTGSGGLRFIEPLAVLRSGLGFFSNFSGVALLRYSAQGLLSNVDSVSLDGSRSASTVEAHPGGLWVARLSYFDNSLSSVSYDPFAPIEDSLAFVSQVDGGNSFEGRFHPGGRILFAIGRDENTGLVDKFLVYLFDSNTGEFSASSQSPLTGLQPRGLVVEPGGNFLYTLHESQIRVHRINQVTGELTEQTPVTISDQNDDRIDVHPSGRFLYASGSELAVYLISQDGSLTELSSSPYDISSSEIIVDPAGRFLYSLRSDTIEGYLVNQTTGELTSNGLSGAVDLSPWATTENPSPGLHGGSMTP